MGSGKIGGILPLLFLEGPEGPRKERMLKVRKPRTVAPENRQRAAYSCDRCKTKKIKCIRIDTQTSEQVFDKSIACSSCLKSKQPCSTSLPRRRRVYGSFENLGIHYQTILTLIQGLYPDIDINDINELISVGEKMGINMSNVTEMNGTDDLTKIELENKILKPFIPKAPSDSNHNHHDTKNKLSSLNNEHTKMITNDASTSIRLNDANNSNNYQISETLIMDSKGGSHYVGSVGTPVLFSVLCNLLLKRSYRTTLSFDNEIKLLQQKNEQREMIDKNQIYELLSKEKKFPLVSIISKEEAIFYTDHFFKFFHPFYFIFDEAQFRAKYELYWKAMETTDEKDAEVFSKELLSSEVGAIYLVWILGSRLVLDATMRNVSLESYKMDEVLKFIMTDAALGSSLSSIQYLFLYSVHLHANKNRDSAWNLVGLAIRQSISLGLHRKMKSSATGNTDLQTQIFWSLYQYELTLCSTFGRPSNINEDEIDIDYPDLSNNTQVSETYKEYFVASLKLSRFLNKIVKDRKVNSMNHQQPISLINIERTLSMKNQLNQIHKDLKIKKLDDIINIFDYKLNLRFHFYMVALILPFLLYITTTNFEILQDETLLSIMKTGIQSAIFVSKLMKLSLLKHFNYGALSTDCMYGYSSTLVLSLFFIYLSNNSNAMQELMIEFEGKLERIDKKLTLDYISNIIEFMHNSQLDATTKRICEVIEGIKNDLKLVEIQDDLRFDTLNFDGTDQMVYDSLFMSNEIYLDGNLV